MRIQDCEIIPTKCANMTEESDFKYGMNGGSPVKQENNSEHRNIASPERAPSENLPQVCAGGGRLKFFKDGKFILELERARAGWVSVPRKTFWPPAAPPIAAGPRQEGSTSLSVSDDNSSVQSSPWQRDHCWKQATPQRSISQETSFFYKRPKRSHPSRVVSLRKRRRPFDTSADEAPCATNGSTSPSGAQRKTGQLNAVLQRLWDRSGGNGTKQLMKQTVSADQHAAMVSPRKRILRELERVTLDDLYNKRRAKVTQAPAPPQPPAATTPVTVVTSTSTASIGSPANHNGGAPAVQVTSSARSSSYSIDSLLGNNTDATDSHKSQQQQQRGGVTVTQQHRYQAAAAPPPPSTTALPYSSASYYGPLNHVYPTYSPRYAALWPQYPPSLLAGYGGAVAPPMWPAHSSGAAHRTSPAGAQPPPQTEVNHADEDLPLNLSKNSR